MQQRFQPLARSEARGARGSHVQRRSLAALRANSHASACRRDLRSSFILGGSPMGLEWR